MSIPTLITSYANWFNLQLYQRTSVYNWCGTGGCGLEPGSFVEIRGCDHYGIPWNTDVHTAYWPLNSDTFYLGNTSINFSDLEPKTPEHNHVNEALCGTLFNCVDWSYSFGIDWSYGTKVTTITLYDTTDSITTLNNN